MNDEDDYPGRISPNSPDRCKSRSNASYGDEVETGPGGAEPRWLRFFYLALYVFAIAYMLWYAGDRWVIKVFASALVVWVAYSFKNLFRLRRG